MAVVPAAATEPRGRGGGSGAVPGKVGGLGAGARTSLPSLPWVPAPVTWGLDAAAAGSVRWLVG